MFDLAALAAADLALATLPRSRPAIGERIAVSRPILSLAGAPPARKQDQRDGPVLAADRGRCPHLAGAAS